MSFSVTPTRTVTIKHSFYSPGKSPTKSILLSPPRQQLFTKSLIHRENASPQKSASERQLHSNSPRKAVLDLLKENLNGPLSPRKSLAESKERLSKLLSPQKSRDNVLNSFPVMKSPRKINCENSPMKSPRKINAENLIPRSPLKSPAKLTKEFSLKSPRKPAIALEITKPKSKSHIFVCCCLA